MFTKISEAYSVLSDADKRADYDRPKPTFQRTFSQPTQASYQFSGFPPGGFQQFGQQFPQGSFRQPHPQQQQPFSGNP
jgi:DnaJ-class molecular chaperone